MPLFGQLQESCYLCHLLASKVFASLVVLGLEVFVYQHPVDTNLPRFQPHTCAVYLSVAIKTERARNRMSAGKLLPVPPFGQQGICFAGGDLFGCLRVAVSCGHESTQISTTPPCSFSTSSIKKRARDKSLGGK